VKLNVVVDMYKYFVLRVLILSMFLRYRYGGLGSMENLEAISRGMNIDAIIDGCWYSYEQWYYVNPVVNVVLIIVGTYAAICYALTS